MTLRPILELKKFVIQLMCMLCIRVLECFEGRKLDLLLSTKLKYIE